MRPTFLLAALIATTSVAAPAAAVTFSLSPVNAGPQTPSGFDSFVLYTDFNSGAPAALTGGSLRTGSLGTIYAAPYNDTTQYYAVGPDEGTPATLAISNFDMVSLYWGSIDYYNTISFLGPNGTVLQSFTGSQIEGMAMPTGLDSRTVTFSLNKTEQALVTGIRFASTTDAFEFDNLAVGSAPEPAVWMTMILGFGLVGSSLRRRKSLPTSMPQTA